MSASGGICNCNSTQKTRKLCYRKDDRAMRPIYGCREHLLDSLTTVSECRVVGVLTWGFVCSNHYYNALATVPSRRYRRRRAYEYRQYLMYLPMVICIFISFPLSVVLKCQRYFVVKFWLSGSFRVKLGLKPV